VHQIAAHEQAGTMQEMMQDFVHKTMAQELDIVQKVAQEMTQEMSQESCG
jgi:hypothetical protein